MNIRIGQGIDFHRLEPGRELWLGGVMIPSERGCVAHSDGDVLLHSICDALLGGAGLRDIGFHLMIITILQQTNGLMLNCRQEG